MATAHGALGAGALGATAPAAAPDTARPSDPGPTHAERLVPPGRAAARFPTRAALGWLALAFLVGLVLFAVRSVLLPFAAGMFLAYFLDPLVDRLQRTGIGRTAASLLVLAVVTILLLGLFLLPIPLLAGQFAALLEELPRVVTRLQALAGEQGGPLLRSWGGEKLVTDVQNQLGELVRQGAGWLAGSVGSIWQGGTAVVGVLSLVVITPVVAFYLLVDWDRMVAAVDANLPLDQRDTARGLARGIDRALAGFVRGQSLLCLLLGAYYAVGLSIVGLNFGVLIGILSGLLSFIPYVGSITGLVLSVGVATVQFWPEKFWILVTLGVFVSGQFIEGNILSPKLVGESAGVHPVWLMFALFAFGALFGFVGLLLAAPMAAALGVLLRFAAARYRASALYDSSLADPSLAEPALAPSARGEA